MESFSAITQQSAAESLEINSISEKQYENSMESRELASLVAHLSNELRGQAQVHKA